MTAIIDTEDYERVKGYRWQAYKKRDRNVWYAGAGVPSDTTLKGRTILFMHRLLLPGGRPMVDHRDGDGLNNRRHNLRNATNGQNLFNQKTKAHTSKYHGVFWHKTRNKWTAQIRADGKRRHLGLFMSENEAYAARLFAEKQFHPDFERTNR